MSSSPNYLLYIIGIIAILAIIAGAIYFTLKNSADRPKQKQGKQPKNNDAARKPASGSSGKLVEIYVGNLSYDVDDNQLNKLFAKFGVIKSARVVINRHNNKSKGYGFVEMPHREEAEIAIKKLNNFEYLGRLMKVNEARRDSRPSDKR